MPDRMTRAEREAFLAEARIGVLSVESEDPERAPVTAPVWYDYSPDSGVTVIMNGKSRKGIAIDATRRFVLVVQSEATPYRYVTVEGPVAEIRATDTAKDLLPLATRYLGEDFGKEYTEEWERAGGPETDLVYVMKPQQWNTADFTSDFS